MSPGVAAGDASMDDRLNWTQRKHGGSLQWLVVAAMDRAGLTARERRILELRFGLEDGRAWTLDEIARTFDVSPGRIRQIEAKALKALRVSKRSRRITR